MGWDKAEDKRAAGEVPADEAQSDKHGWDTDNAKKSKKEKKKHGCFFKLFMTVVVLFAVCVGAAVYVDYQKKADETKAAAEWENATYTWPTSGLAALLPQPDSKFGEVKTYSDSRLSVEVRQTDMGAYGNYVEACKAKGFTEDATSTSSSYKAHDQGGNQLSVSYNSLRSYMDIDLESASSDEDETAQPAATSEAAPAESADSSDAGSQSTTDQAMDALGTIANVVSDATSGAVTPEFKEFIDSYESFMNDYCDFMEKYTGTETSGDTATLTAMMADYTSLLQQELEWVDKINAVDQSSLSAADSAYYLAATARVEKRLIEIGQSAS